MKTLISRKPPSRVHSSESQPGYSNAAASEDEAEALMPLQTGDEENGVALAKDDAVAAANSSSSTTISKTALGVLVLLAVQNCSKNLLMRYVRKNETET